MEQEHKEIGDIEHIRDDRAKLKEEMRRLKQDINEFAVRQFPLFYLPPSQASPFLGYALRTSKNESTPI